MAEEKLSPHFQKLASITDIFAKLCAGAAAIFAGIYLTWWKNDFDIHAKCLELVSGIATEYRGKTVSAGELESRAGLLAATCSMPQEQLLNTLRSVVQVHGNEPAKVASAQSVDLPLRIPGMSTDTQNKSAPTSPPGPAAADGLLAGWLAIGFLGSKTYSDVNFDKVDGTSLSTLPAPGTTLRSRWQVYVRPGPADWSKTVGVLATGQCFTVDQARALSAGEREQTWAQGKAVACPSGKS